MNNDEKNVDKDVEISRPYYLRQLKDKDLFTVLAIIDKIFPGDKLQEAFDQVSTKGKTMEEVGIQVSTKLGFALIRNIVTAHDEIYALLSDVSGLPVNIIDDMPFGTGPMMILDIIQDARNADFFRVVSRLA